MPVKIDVIEDFSSNPIDPAKIIVDYKRGIEVNPKNFAEKIYNFDKSAAKNFLSNYKAEESKLMFPNTELAFLTDLYDTAGGLYVEAVRGDWKFLNPRRQLYSDTDSLGARNIIIGEVTPIGMGSVTVSDGYIILARRGYNIQVPGSVINTPVGNLDYNQEKGRLYRFVERLEERASVKVGWPSSKYKVTKLLGVVRGLGQSLNPNFCFSAELDMGLREVFDNLDDVKKTSKLADSEIIPVKSEKDSILRAVKQYAPHIVDNGMGMLYMYSKNEFGEGFAEELAESVKDYFKFDFDIDLRPHVDY